MARRIRPEQVVQWAPLHQHFASMLEEGSEARLAFDSGRYQSFFRPATGGEAHSETTARNISAWVRGYQKNWRVIEESASFSYNLLSTLKGASRTSKSSAAVIALGMTPKFEHALLTAGRIIGINASLSTGNLYLDQDYGVTIEQLYAAERHVQEDAPKRFMFLYALAAAPRWFARQATERPEMVGKESFPDHAAMSTYGDKSLGTFDQPGTWEADYLRTAGDLQTAVMYAHAGVTRVSDLERYIAGNIPVEYAGAAS